MHDHNWVHARELLINAIKEAMPTPQNVPVVTTPASVIFDESWEQQLKRRRMEKQAEVMF